MMTTLRGVEQRRLARGPVDLLARGPDDIA